MHTYQFIMCYELCMFTHVHENMSVCVRVCQVHVPTDLCCSGWFWQWWWCAGVSWSSCCPPWHLPPPLPASSLSLWHAHSCGSACGSSRAWAGPGHPPPATPSHWTLTHTPPRSAHSPPPRSPAEEGTHADIQCVHANTQMKTQTHRSVHAQAREKIKMKNKNAQAHTSTVQDKGEWPIYYRSKSQGNIS